MKWEKIVKRLLSDLIWCYKIVFGLVDINSHDFFMHKTVSVTRGHGYKLFKRSTSGMRSNFFCERVINAWNN